jgi:hypothetical protein
VVTPKLLEWGQLHRGAGAASTAPPLAPKELALEHSQSITTPLATCKYGHPFTPENTLLIGKRQARRCRICFTAYQRRYGQIHRPEKAAQRRAERARHPEQAAEYSRRLRRTEIERVRARQAVADALRRGKLVRPAACERCGQIGRVVGHHHDYDRRLDVAWLCSPCHKAVHG